MKENKLTKGSNMRWSAKFILPEHAKALKEHQLGMKILPRPSLDDDELLRISEALAESYTQRTLLTMTVYGRYEAKTLSGIVEKIDQVNRRVRIGPAWVDFEKIIDVSLG